LLFAFLSVFFFSSCGDHPTTASNADAAVQPAAPLNFDSLKKVIEEKDKNFTSAFVKGDSSTVVNAYTTDARIFPPNHEMIAGQQAIGTLVSQFFKYGIKEFRDSTTSLYGNEENLIEEGSFFMADAKGNVMDKGKYLVVWKKVSGDWKIYSDIWNTSLSPAPMKK